MTQKPIRVDSDPRREQHSCQTCGQPSGIFDTCKACDRAVLDEWRKEARSDLSDW